MSWLKSNRSLIAIIFLLLLISFPAISPLFYHGFFVTDDGEWMIIRLSAFYQTLHDGQLPVRFLGRLNFDYGYPVATFLYPGFMYLGVLIHLLKIGFVDTTKIILGLSLTGTTIFTYLWLNKIYNNKLAAFVGAAVSLYLPYHLYDVYTRGSVGEVFALLWVPFILWMIERKNIFFIAIGILLLLISHNTIAMFFLPVIFIYSVLRKTFKIKQILICFILGILMSSFFIIPAVFELSYTNFSNIKISNPQNYFADFTLIGFSTFIIFIFAGGFLIFNQKHKNSSIYRLFLIITFLAIFLSSSWSGFIWQIIPSSFIQFPFRLLSYLVISLPFLIAFIIFKTNNRNLKSIYVVLIFVLLISSVFANLPKTYIDKGEGYFATNDATTTVKDEYMPVWVKEKSFQRPNKKVEIIQGQAEVKNLRYNNKKLTFSIDAKTNSKVKINTIYWPGWQAFIDNRETLISYNNVKGVIELNIVKGQHDVQILFGETKLRFIYDVISILSFSILIFFSFRNKNEN